MDKLLMDVHVIHPLKSLHKLKKIILARVPMYIITQQFNYVFWTILLLYRYFDGFTSTANSTDCT